MKTFKTPKGTELHLLDMRGKDYLEVKWRILWFREEKPDWAIQTEFVSTTADSAFCKASILNQEGRIIATSHKFEDKQGFGDFREKAETGAIGRALALIGYGTQFCAEELEEGKRIVDSPVSRSDQRIYPSPEQPTSGDGNVEPTGYRIRFGKWAQRSLEEVEREHGIDEMDGYASYLVTSAKNTRKPISILAQEYIDNLKAFKDLKFAQTVQKTSEIKAKIAVPAEQPKLMDEGDIPF